MEHINQLRAWKNQADKAGLDIKDEHYNVVLRLLNHALEAHDRIKQIEEALSIAMIGGDYLESERRQLNIVLKGK